MHTYFPRFNNQESETDFLTEESAQEIMNDIKEFEFVLPIDTAKYFVFRFNYKVYTERAKNKFENLGYNCEI